MHVVIAGNGILALTTAFRLAKRLTPRDEVSIIGKPARPGSASLAAAAMLNSFAELEAGSLASELGLYRFELSRAAGRMWPGFITEIIDMVGASTPLSPSAVEGQGPCGGCFGRGTFVISNPLADSLDDENFDAILEALRRFDEPHELVPPSSLPNYMPKPGHGASRALFMPNEGWLNPRLAMQALEAALRRRSLVRFIDGEVERFASLGARLGAAILTDGRRIEGDQFLLATGATATEVLSRSRLGLPVQRVFYGVGVSVEIRSPVFPHEKCIRTPHRALGRGVYTVPYLLGPDLEHDHVLIGASSFISATPIGRGSLGSVKSLLRAGMTQINQNFARGELVRINVGWRPTSQDTYPLLGKTSVPNLCIATGTRRDGFHLSPVLSERLAALLLQDPVDERFFAFAPERKLIHSLTRDEAIAKALHQSGVLDGPPREAQAQRTALERLHDQVGASEWGIPPEMLEMYRLGHAVGDGLPRTE
jgi:glycine/D-amino acid oxidase-like deaminating enzyme